MSQSKCRVSSQERSLSMLDIWRQYTGYWTRWCDRQGFRYLSKLNLTAGEHCNPSQSILTRPSKRNGCQITIIYTVFNLYTCQNLPKCKQPRKLWITFRNKLANHVEYYSSVELLYYITDGSHKKVNRKLNRFINLI